MVSFVTTRRSWNFILSGCLKYGLNLRFLPGIAGNSQPFLLGKVPKSVRSYLVIFWSYLVIFGHICGYFWPIWKHEANVSLGKPRNGLRRGLGHLSYIWWVSRIQIFKFSNVTVTFWRLQNRKKTFSSQKFCGRWSKKLQQALTDDYFFTFWNATFWNAVIGSKKL